MLVQESDLLSLKRDRIVMTESGNRMAEQIFTIRSAEEKDCGVILSFIKALAAYENLADEVVADEAILQDSLFVKRQAEVIIGEEAGEPVAFALFFHNFSTFLGKANLYLEDLFVKESCRGKGYGVAMLKELACIAARRNCGRLDWWCLDWNTEAIAFYKKIGAVAMDDWTVYRLEGDRLRDFAGDVATKAERVG